jgi:hypothetical protein
LELKLENVSAFVLAKGDSNFPVLGFGRFHMKMKLGSGLFFVEIFQDSKSTYFKLKIKRITVDVVFYIVKVASHSIANKTAKVKKP